MEENGKNESFIDERSRMLNLMRIFKILLDKENQKKRDNIPTNIPPSEFTRQILMTTEQRTDSLLKSYRKFDFQTGCNDFKVIPSIVIFQQYHPGNVYNVNLTIRNVTKTLKYLRINCEVDPCFTVEHRGTILNTKIAPGMAIMYNVKFFPDDTRDYEYRAIFETESENVIIPIIAIGPRPLLDFPDRIEVPSTAVKIPSSKSLLVRNIGDLPAVFTLYTNSSYFSIEPLKGVIEKDERVQFTVHFLSTNEGDFEGTCLLKYESGETITLELQGSAINCNIRLDRGSVRFEDTYLGMSRSKSFSIHNRSDYIVKFQWMQYKNSEMDTKQREKYKRIFDTLKSTEEVRCADLVHYDVCEPETHDLICQRIYKDEVASLMNDPFLFHNKNFVLSPMEGEIWPRSSLEVNIFFQPEKVGEISSTAYLDVSGREDRIPLSFHGMCKGPVFQFNIVSGDVDYIFLCSVHNYEIICANKGFIPGTMVHRPKSTDFGGKIIVDPPQLKLKPEEYKSFNLSFSSNRIGEFIEQVEFVVKESLEVISIRIKGRVVCPTLHFNEKSLDFGVTPLGFMSKREICLRNLSLVPVTFCMNVPGDGVHPPMTHEDFANAKIKPSFPACPREFFIEPNKATVAAQTSLKVEISYTPNILRTGQTSVRLDMWDLESESVFLPVSFCSKVASLIIKPSEIAVRFCFINFPYTRNITVENKSDIDGYFYLVPQAVSTSTGMLYSLSTNQGYLKSGESKTISLTIITSVLGRQQTTLSLLTFGEEVPAPRCTLICNGQGPVVSVQPVQHDWNEVELLQEKTLKLTMISDSPIPAEFKAILHKRNSPWTVHPTSGELQANQSLELQVKLFLRDAGKYSDRILITIVNSRTITISLSAIGIGTSIVFQPQVFPTYNMGLLFSHQNINLPITMTNEGTRHHQLLWSNSSELNNSKKGVVQIPTYNKFQVEPCAIDLPAGATAIVYCKIHWGKNETVSEQWYLHGLIKGYGKREVLGSSLFNATFIEPNIFFDKKEVTFRMDIGPNDSKIQQIDELYVTNESRLNLNTHLSVDSSFRIITDSEEYVQEMDIILVSCVQTRIRVYFCFDQNDNSNLYSKMYRGLLKLEYKEHPNKDKIKCTAQVNYPNVVLQPNEINFSCELNCSVNQDLMLTNSGPVPVFYKFKWIEENIDIKCYLLDVEQTESLASVSAASKVSGILQAEPIDQLKPPLKSFSSNEEQHEKDKSEIVRTEPETKSESMIMASSTEPRHFCLPNVKRYITEDPEISVLENVSHKPPFVDCINNILDIAPHEGQVAPYSSQIVAFVFHGLEPMQVEAKAVCEVLHGPTEIVKITASANTIRFSLDRNIIDFGNQIFCKVCHSSLTLKNYGLIRFTYKIDTIDESMDMTTDINQLRVKPSFGVVQPESEIELEVIYYPGVPGPFSNQFELEIGHTMPLVVRVEGIGTFPQVYLSVPRDNLVQMLPVEQGYYAIVSLIMISSFEGSGASNHELNTNNNITRISKLEEERLHADGWCVISSGQTYPSIVDIDMSIERLMARQFIKDNLYVLMKHNTAHKKRGIPFLFSPAYVIDMGYVIIGQMAHYTAMLFNYGPTKAEVRMKKHQKKDHLVKSGIIVQFRDQTNLQVGDYTTLQVTFHPPHQQYMDRSTDVKHQVYIEVTHGYTLPIRIVATVTYPFLEVNTSLLEFKDVAIGQCLLMPLLLKNESRVECQWEAKLTSSLSKNKENPFYLYYTSDLYSPGQVGTMNVYFKPRKAGYVETKLNLIVKQGLEQLAIVLMGRGIEPKLNIVKTSITFPSLIPYSRFEEQTFNIENVGPYPVEFYWHHLDDEFSMEDRIVRVLTHYYRVNEILLPVRQLGDKLPQQLLLFYKNLTSEMASTLAIQKREKSKFSEPNELEESIDKMNIELEEDQARQQIITDLPEERRQRKSNARGKVKKKKSTAGSLGRKSVEKDDKSLSISNNFNVLEEPSTVILTNDPDEIERLLHCYIDDLQKDNDFLENMKDPVKEVFDFVDSNTTLASMENLQLGKKICIIFHGAPFTEYQDVACRSATILGVPLFNVNKAILEIIALGSSMSSIKLREIIDLSYQDYLSRSEWHREQLAADRADKNNLIVDESGTIKQNTNTVAPINVPEKILPKNNKVWLYTDPDPFNEFKKIPVGDELEGMDLLSKYECKVEAILLMQKIIASSMTNSPISAKAMDREKSEEKTFLGISLDLLTETFEQRLSMPDFEVGFVLQSLDNIFVTSEIDTFLLLLKLVGNVEYLMFVTFYNTMSTYNLRNDKLLREDEIKRAEIIARKLEAFEDMTQSELDELSEEDKRLYIDVVLATKRRNTLLRQQRYRQQLDEARKKRIVRVRVSKEVVSKKNISKIGKSKASSSRDVKSMDSKPSGKKEIDNTKKATGTNNLEKKSKEPILKELEQLSEAMDRYQTSLNAIQLIIEDWNSSVNLNNEVSPEKDKIMKTSKGKDRTTMEENMEVKRSAEFYVWYIRASDPWNNQLDETVISQMAKNDLAKNVLVKKSDSEMDLRPKMYSVFVRKDVRSSSPIGHDIFKLLEISQVLEETELIEASMINKQESQVGTYQFPSKKERSKGLSSQSSVMQIRSKNTSVADLAVRSGNILFIENGKQNNFVSCMEVKETLKSRWIMQPNETQKFKILFCPEKMGIYQRQYTLTTIGSDVTYNIMVNGSADIPRLNMDPAVIFTMVEDTKVDETNDSTFFLNTQTYDFGSLLLSRKDKRVHHRKVELTFFNISSIQAEVSVFLMDNNSDAFHLYPEQLLITPDDFGILEVTAEATKLGSNIDKIVICIKNNPQVEMIQLRSNGIKLDVELEEKQVAFGRILLYRKETRTVTVHNKCTIPVFWKLIPVHMMDSQVTFSPFSGFIKPLDQSKIEFCYCAMSKGVIEKNTLSFKVYLNEEDDESLLQDTITISGETYDVSVDISFANPIDLKNVKVNSSISESFVIKNRGPYEIEFTIHPEQEDKLIKIDSDLPKNLKEDLLIQPISGSVSPEKSIDVIMNFIPRKEMVLNEAPFLKCHLIDRHKTISTVAELPLTVSLVSYYTRFRLQPYPDLNFGAMGIYTERTMYLNVENIGKFPLNYTIKASNDSMIQPLQTKKDRKDKKTSLDTEDTSTSKRDKKSPKTLKAAGDSSNLKIGPLTFNKYYGHIEAGQVESVAIDCYAETEGLREEEIVILVPDSIPEDSAGKKMTVIINCCIPNIDFKDLDAIFQENYIVDYIQDFVCLKEIGSHTVFARQEKCLYFRHFTVLNTHTVQFKLYNPGLVPADVIILLLPHKSALSDKSNAFTVNPLNECIPPLSNKTFTISFMPSLIETYTAMLEVTVKLPAMLKSPKMTIKLSGESCVPQVNLVEPLMQSKRKAALISFGRILIGEMACGSLVFENIGYIKATIIVEIRDDPSCLFVLENSNNSGQLQRVSNYEDDVPNDPRCVVCQLIPEELARVNVKFTPEEVGKYESQIRIVIVDNPYENFSVDLVGEGYNEIVVLEGLELAEFYLNNGTLRRKLSQTDSIHKLKRTNSRLHRISLSADSVTAAPTLTYNLNYGTCFLNRMNRVSFKIVNRSSDRYFRFEWNQHPNVVFTPTVGHLNECGSKEIVATFLASEPIVYVETVLECSLYEIEFPESIEVTAWDDRQSSVNWIKMNFDSTNLESSEQTLIKKIVEPTSEPVHILVPGTSRNIRLLFSAIAACSEYFCAIEEIHFEDTLMFQTREYKFTLKNSGIVNMEYAWKIAMDEHCHSMCLSNMNLRIALKSKSNAISTSRPGSRSFNGTLYPRAECHPEEVDLRPSIPHGPIKSYKKMINYQSSVSSECISDLSNGTESCNEEDHLPLEIKPESGILFPDQSIDCTLKFSPLDVLDYKAHLVCTIENLDPKQTPLSIVVTARSLLPYCHFDINKSNYLTSGRRDPKQPAPSGFTTGNFILENINVVEFQVVGVRKHYVKKFSMINPTSEDYHFSWSDRSIRSLEEIAHFHCSTTEGIAERGKLTEMTFIFLSDDVGTFESFWLFSIEKYQLEILFLLVAFVREPSVHCSVDHLKMKPTVIGTKTRDSITIINNEKFPLSFRILPDSLYSESGLQGLSVKPMRETLQPNSELILSIEFQSEFVGESKFLVRCCIAKMKNALNIIITTTVYNIVPVISYINIDNQASIIYHDRDNIIDFGNIIPKEPVILKFEITNAGKMPFHYSWDLAMEQKITSKRSYVITVEPKQGCVTSESRLLCQLTLITLKKVQIQDHHVFIKINKGPIFRLLLKATARRLSYELNFSLYDFGPRYIQETNTAPYRIDIRLTNFEETPCIVECKFKDVPYMTAKLDRLFEAVIGQSSISIPIYFRPLEPIRYSETLIFLINSTIEKKVVITGEGIPYKVCLVNPRDRSIDLGNLPVGKTVIRKISVMNKGRASIELIFNLIRNLTVFDDHRYRIQPCSFEQETNEKRNYRDVESTHQTNSSLSEILSVQPSELVILQPNKQIDIFLKFAPTRRMKAFTDKIAVQVHSTILPLSIIRGSCIGADFHLNRTHISFGAIVEGCTCETKLILVNTGDLGAKFKWNTENLHPNFRITPLAGYSSSGIDVTFIVTFQPVQLSNIFEGKATIEIEKYKKLYLTMNGGCCKLPNPIDTVHFVVKVRESLTKHVNIVNDTNHIWQIEVIVTGDYFTATDTLQVPPKESSLCSITYAPLVMTKQDHLHKGSVLFRLPDDKVPILYTLIGTSLPPEPSAKIVRQFPAKTKYTELLPVFNWLNKAEKFTCKIEPINELKGNVYSFTGNNKIDVPANSQRDYRALFHCYKESNFHFRVTFANQEGEYQYYEICYEITKPEVLESISMTTFVRTPVCHLLKLDNPLKDQSVNYCISCSHCEVTVYDAPRTVLPLSSEIVKIEFYPLLVLDDVIPLDIRSAELGIFPYELRLKAAPAPVEKTIHVVASLGNSSTFSVTIKNYSKKNAEFTIKVDDSFICESNISVPGLKESTLNVIYEPNDIQNVMATLIASSKIAGEFMFPIVGTVTFPTAQGPFTVQPGTTKVIPFRNIFRDTKTFEYILDDPSLFSTEIPSETIASKKSTNIIVKLSLHDVEHNENKYKHSVIAKLIVSCTDPTYSHINWIYYLRSAPD